MKKQIEKKESCTTTARVAVTTFSLSTHGLSFIERNLNVWILSKKSSCIRRKTTKMFICELWCATKDTVLHKIHHVELRRESGAEMK